MIIVTAHVSTSLKITIFTAVLLCLSAPDLFAQPAVKDTSFQMQTAEQIAAWNLLRNQAVADLYDDLKESWIIQDHFLKLDIASALINRNILLKGETNLRSFNAFDLTKGLRNNTVTVIAKKQYGANKLENIIIESDSQKITLNIEDSDYLHELLGDNTYETILRKDYPHEYLRAEEVPQLREVHVPTFDFTFSALAPELMLFSARGKVESRWYVSLFGNFGVEQIDLPLWARGTGTVGIRVKQRRNILPPGRDYDFLSLQLGWEEPANFSVQKGSPFETILKQPKLVGSSSNIFLKAMYIPWDSEKGFHEFGIEASISVIPKNVKEIPARLPSEFYTIRNYITGSYKANQIANWIDVGGGITWHDLDHVTRLSGNHLLKDLEPTQYNFIPYFEAGISKQWTLLQFSLGGRINYDLNEKFGFMSYNARVSITNSFGIDFRYHRAFPGALPVWQSRDYIVVSPIIHISY